MTDDDIPLIPAASRQAMTAGTGYSGGGTPYVSTPNGQNPSTTALGVIHNIGSNSSRSTV